MIKPYTNQSTQLIGSHLFNESVPIHKIIEQAEHMLVEINADNEVIGFIEGDVTKRCVYIGTLYVLPDYRNKGVGSSLVKAFIEKYKRDCVEVTFPMFKSGFYEKLGFETMWNVRLGIYTR